MSLATLGRGRPLVLCHIDLIQDLDVLLPVILTALDDDRLKFRVVVSRWLETASPRVALKLASEGVGFRFVPRRYVEAGRTPSLWRVAALLTASESNQLTHSAGHALAKRANARGVPTFTLQHGLDSLADVRFASSRIFSWFTENSTPSGLVRETRDKLLPVGRPMLRAVEQAPAFDVGVFENLHAEVYSEMERAGFVAQLEEVLSQRPATTFYIRAHPAGRWLEDLRPRLARHRHVTFAPASTSPTVLSPGYHEAGRCRRVVTTPSTVALDAAMAGRPAALALRGGGTYASLPVLANLSGWLDFVDGSLDAQARLGGTRLLDSIMTRGDPAGRILNHLFDASSSRKASK